MACIFKHFESFCGVPPEKGKFSTFIQELRYELPRVTWNYWDNNPPPPPPRTTRTALEQYMDDDPDGMELTQEALGECFPRMKYVGSMSFGSNVGKDRSPDGQGYGPIYQPNRYSFSAAFLATENFRDKDSLSARMIQSRFTGHWRFACQ
jgi:hypothetical protein